jgi:RNA-directed DNA polymerase
MLKKNKLRFNEYYNMQSLYDGLYHQSKNGNNFYKLIEIIGSKQNIRLAYRNIKTNKGSKTPGTDGLTIQDIKHINDDTLIDEIRNRLANYKPQTVRRVLIEKEGSNKKRPLGIPTIWDRILQQCILQVLEPICEPKFHNHSYGFRANRSTHHALSRVAYLVNMGKHHYCVDIDIKGFFDNVNHGKLLKQMWTLGIRDKRLISIISKLLKSEIEGEGVPQKGTPQGGILSPLLSLIVLNELDWWVSDQWETYVPRRSDSKGFYQRARKGTKLKDGFIIRYADDFKIMCKTYEEAQRYYHAVTDFLKVRLKLDISPEKSKVVNLKKNSSSFLGFKIKAVQKGTAKHKYVAKTDMNDKSIKKVKINLKCKLKKIQKSTLVQDIYNYNSTVLGIQNYYRYATNIYKNMQRINYDLLRTMKVCLSPRARIIEFGTTSLKFQKQVKGLRKHTKIYEVKEKPLIPITGIHHKILRSFKQSISNFTVEGREKIHTALRAFLKKGFYYFSHNIESNNSIEVNDNRISKYSQQGGKCYIKGSIIEEEKIYCYRKVPLELGGTDDYKNLVIINKDILNLLNETNADIIKQTIETQKVNETMMDKINKLRTMTNKPIINL